jgi:translation initiation factor IF-2
MLGFRVVPDGKARKLIEENKVDLRTYRVIYELLEDLRLAMEGALKPMEKEKITGHLEIRQVFKSSRIGNIAGCFVTDGVIKRSSKIRLVRDGVVIYEGDIETLKRFKDDQREVKEGYECGLKIAGYDDIKAGDVVEAYEIFEEKRTLAQEAPADSAETTGPRSSN